MRVLVAVTLSLFALVGCRHRIGHVAGAYEMVRIEGKPLPFLGVRGGELYLRPDGTFMVLTHRARVMGGAATFSDTVPGTFGLHTWGGECVGIWMEIPGLPEGPRVRVSGEVCGDTLFTHYDGGVFRKTKVFDPSGFGSPPRER
jgi:hypothetical protein